MPQNATYAIDMGQTFTSVIYMASAAKLRFGTQEPDTNAAGEKKWGIQAAVTYKTEPDRPPMSEVIPLTITGPASDPCALINPGTPVILEGLRVGFSPPEKGENDRIRGGRPWFSCSGIRPAQGQSRPLSKENAA